MTLPKFSVMGTQPYQIGKRSLTPIAGTAPIEKDAYLEIPGGGADGCSTDYGDVTLFFHRGYGQSGVWPPAIGDTFLAEFGSTDGWSSTCVNGGYTATFTSNDDSIAEVNNGDFNTLVRPLDPDSNVSNGGTIISIGPIKKAGTLTITVTVDAPSAPGQGTMTKAETITIT